MDLNVGMTLAFLPQGPGSYVGSPGVSTPTFCCQVLSTQRPSIQGLGNCGRRSQLPRATPGHELCDPGYVA